MEKTIYFVRFYTTGHEFLTNSSKGFDDINDILDYLIGCGYVPKIKNKKINIDKTIRETLIDTINISSIQWIDSYSSISYIDVLYLD